MKPKKLNQKLSLNKETIVHLSSDEINNIKGRGTTTCTGLEITCPFFSCEVTFCATCGTCNPPCIHP